MVSLTDEQRMIVDAVTELAENEFAEKACTWQGEYPSENVELLAENDFLCINLPEEYGGGGMTEMESLLVMESVGRVCPDTAKELFKRNFISPRMVAMFGTDAAKERYLPQVTSGKESIAIAISEPQGGSNIQGIETTAEPDGDTYVLNGEKIWVSEPQSSYAVVWAKISGSLGALIVDLDADGVELNEVYTNMFGGSQGHFFFNDVKVPAENVLVEGEEAFNEMSDSLNWERLGGAVFANLIAVCAFEKALEYSQEREQFGQPIGDFQGMEWRMSDMVTEIEVSRAITYQAAKSAERNDRTPNELETTIAKAYSAEMCEEVVSDSLQMFGAAGYQQDHPLEYLHRLARSRRIGGGTTEMQKNSIATLLKQNGYSMFDKDKQGQRVEGGEHTQL